MEKYVKSFLKDSEKMKKMNKEDLSIQMIKHKEILSKIDPKLINFLEYVEAEFQRQRNHESRIECDKFSIPSLEQGGMMERAEILKTAMSIMEDFGKMN